MHVVVLDLGNVLIRWEPVVALAAGVGQEQARAFLDLATSGVDFGAWNHRQDAGGSWDDAEPWLAKPDQAVFDLTADRIGRDPSEIFFTDDSPPNVAAALAAGWDATLFTGASDLRTQLVERRLLAR